VLAFEPPTAAQASEVQHWNTRPRMDTANNRSMVSTALLLNELNLLPPATPRLYAQLHTVEELLHDVRRTADAMGPSQAEHLYTAIDELAAATGAREDKKQRINAALHSLTALLYQYKVADDWLPYGWNELLTNNTGCMSRGGSRQHGAAPPSRPALARCVLRLEFSTPLVSMLVQHHLVHAYYAAAAAGAEAQQQPLQSAGTVRLPKARVSVQPYFRRLTVTDAVGFTIGPINPGAHAECTSRSEPHGNWELLRNYLQRAAPNCAPASWRALSKGVASVRFVLEERHRHELYALATSGAVNRDFGITRPLKLTLEVSRYSTDTACSTCGAAGHAARVCPNRSADNAMTCRRCYHTGHTAIDCPTAMEQLVCGLCQQTGHPTTSCKRYRPSFVKVVVKPPTTVRSTLSYSAATSGPIAHSQRLPDVVPASAQRVPSDSPASLQRGSSEWPARGQRGAREGPERGQRGASEGPERGQRGASDSPASGQRETSESGQQMAALTQLMAMLQQFMQQHAQQMQQSIQQQTQLMQQMSATQAAQTVMLERMLDKLSDGQRLCNVPTSSSNHYEAARQHTPSPTASTASSPSTPSTSSQSSTSSQPSMPVQAEYMQAHSSQPATPPVTAPTNAQQQNSAGTHSVSQENVTHNATGGMVNHVAYNPVIHVTPLPHSNQPSAPQPPPSYIGPNPALL